MNYNAVVSQENLAKTVDALSKNGFKVMVMQTGAEAKQKALELIPAGSEVMTMTSVTLDTLGITDAINNSGTYNSVRLKLNDPATPADVKRKIGAGPEYAIGSVHALTEDGHAVIASNTGSQLPAYVYGAAKVIWVVGAQKLVKNDAEAVERIYEHVLPLEADRARKAYGVAGSNVSKLLTISKEVNPDRITILIVNEVLGF